MDYRDADWIVFHENEEKLLSFPCFLDIIGGWPPMTIERTDHDAAGMSTKSRHLTIPDLITIGVFTALYFVLVAVATLFSSVALMGFGMILLPAVAALICGCVYMLLVAKVGKFGAISVMGIVVGLFLFVSGHFILSLAASHRVSGHR